MISEARHARNWGLDEGSIPAIVLTKEDHDAITKLLFDRLPRGTEHSRERVWAVYQEAYSKYPDGLDAIRRYFP